MSGGGKGVVDVVDVVERVVIFFPFFSFNPLGFGEYLGIFLSMYLITFWTLFDPNPSPEV